MKPTDWREVLHLLQKEGRVVEAGPRITAWRESRGWTLAELGAALDRDKSVVWKIEKGRRDITVEEALAVSEIFGKTLLDLLLPEDSSTDLRRALEWWAEYDEAERILSRIRADWDEYERAISSLRRMSKDATIRSLAESRVVALENAYRVHWESAGRQGRDVPADLRDFVRLQDPTPATQVPRDVLSASPLPSAPWAYRGKDAAHVA